MLLIWKYLEYKSKLMLQFIVYFLGYFSVTLCSHYFCNFHKKGPRPKWTIYKHVLDDSKKCLSVVVVVVCRLSVARLQPTPAYVEA